jgi:hypothetical protein
MYISASNGDHCALGSNKDEGIIYYLSDMFNEH